MLGKIGPWELVILLVILLLVFGVGRISKIGRELGEGIRGFQKGLRGEEEKGSKEENKEEGEDAAV